jgi:hypothetical protein
VAQRSILSVIEANYGKCFTDQWIASFLKSHNCLIYRPVVRPQENLRLEVSHEHLDHPIKQLQEYVPLVPIELLFNLDENGFSDWEERKPKSVLIPLEGQATTIHYPTSGTIPS